MKFRLENIASIKKAEIEIGNFNVLFGNNNTGKTFVTYALYGFLKETNILPILKIIDFIAFLKNNKEYKLDINTRDINKKINKLFNNQSSEYSKEINNIFNTNKELFNNTNFEFISKINLEDIMNKIKPINHKLKKQFINLEKKINDFSSEKRKKEINKNKTKDNLSKDFSFILHFLKIFQEYFEQSVFILSAERTGIQIFQKELDKNRSNLINQLIKNSLSNRDLSKMLEKETSSFSLPLQDNIDFIRDIENIQKKDSFLKEKHPELIDFIEDFLGVKYQVLNGQLLIIDKQTNEIIPSYLSSTSVRSLFSLHLWLKHKAQKGDLLMIDEPELNLHPENQIKLTRLFAMLVNVGIKVWITTHSDYIIKELNNLLMLSNNLENKNELLKNLGYQENQILKVSDVKAYLAKNDGYVKAIEIDEYGLLETSFDDVMININDISNRIITEVEKL